MKIVFSRLMAWAAAVAVLPACWAASVALTRTLPEAFATPAGGGPGWIFVPEGWAFIAGAAFYLIWHRVRPPEFLYTFTHEFTHLIFAVLCGKRVSRFVVSKDSGQVSMSGTNFLITLAPYFFPLLTAIVLAAGAALEWGLGNPRYRPVVAFLTGLTLAFHLTMTLRTLATSQPDIDRGGKLFSWSVVYLFGILFAGSTIFLSAGGGVLDSYLGGLFHEGLIAYTWSAGQFLEWFRIVFSWVAGN